MRGGYFFRKSQFFWGSLVIHVLIIGAATWHFSEKMIPARVASKEGLVAVELTGAGSPPAPLPRQSFPRQQPKQERAQLSEPLPPVPASSPEPSPSQAPAPVQVSVPVASEASQPSSKPIVAPVSLSSAFTGEKVQSGDSAGEPTQKASPSYSENPRPVYPDIARRRGQQGVVVLRVWVSKVGFPTKLEVLKSSGYGLLDKAAQESVMRWKFHPALLGNCAIDSVVEVPIRFQMM